MDLAINQSITKFAIFSQQKEFATINQQHRIIHYGFIANIHLQQYIDLLQYFFFIAISLFSCSV